MQPLKSFAIKSFWSGKVLKNLFGTENYSTKQIQFESLVVVFFFKRNISGKATSSWLNWPNCSFPQPKIESICLALSKTNFERDANTFFMSLCNKCLPEKRYKITFSSITSVKAIGFWHIEYQNLRHEVGHCLEV